MSYFVPLLARNEAANQWLKDNPLVMAAIFGVLGAVLVVTGTLNLLSGKATGKWGTQHSGGMAVFMGGLRVVGGIVCVGVALYTLANKLF